MGDWKNAMKFPANRIAVTLVLLALGFAANAGNGKSIRQQTELSMLVKASIDIKPDGSVDHYAIEDAAKVPPSVVGIIERHVPDWKFEPTLVDGKPVAVHTNAKLVIIARPNADGSYSAGILRASFSGGISRNDNLVRLRDRDPPITYPSFGWVLMSGDVYVALKIGPDGKVIDAIVRRVDLTTSASGTQMAKARKALGDSTLQAVRKWTFDVPTQGKYAGQPYWSGTLPVIFDIGQGEGRQVAGEWRAYLPGPCTEIPWRVLEDESPKTGDCVMALEALDSDGPRLLTPLM